MHPDSTTEPAKKARENRASSGLPVWTTWHRLDEDLPQWYSWATLADASSPEQGSADSDIHLEGEAPPQAPRLYAGDEAKRFTPGARHSSEWHRPFGDDYQPSGDGVLPSGDGVCSSDERHSSLDQARTRRNEKDEGGDEGQPDASILDGDAGTAAGNGHVQGSVNLRSDGHDSASLPGDVRDSASLRGDGYDSASLRGDGHESANLRGGGTESAHMRADGHESANLHGDGHESANFPADGHESASLRSGRTESADVPNEEHESDAVHSDGSEAHASTGDDYAYEAEFEEISEPWNDLSQFRQVEAPPRRTVPSDAGEDAESDENFSPIDLRDRVVIMLLFKQLVQIEDVQKANLRWAKQSGGKSKEPLWRVLAADPAFDREKIFAEAAQVYAFKEAQFERKSAATYIKNHKDRFDASLWGRMSKLRVLPIRQESQTKKKEKRLIFVSHDPSHPDVNLLMRELRLESFEIQYAPESEIDALIEEAFPKRNEYLDRVTDDEFAYDLGTSYDQSSSLIDEDALEAEISRSSLINLFEASLVEAVRRGVSDIHIFPNSRKQIEIHFRVNGELECWHREERVHPEALLAVVKDNTHNVDRFERDTAQDGFIQRKVDDTLIRYRVSVLPVTNANQEIRSESIVIRVLDDRRVITDLGKLGLLDRARSKFEWAIRQPHGMVILTGPTGSGKTTTLFAALHQVVTSKVNVLTVEDPVEYVIPGVRQIKLSHKLELEHALRSILRHDPDIVMVGEMRDRETADLAIKLANTGHLTFSTLHTNDAPSAISRLFKMGVEPFLIAYAINLVVAQRLVRTLCKQCKRPVENLDHEMLLRLGFSPEELAQAHFYEEGRKPGCRACGGSGYHGRRAITETMAFTPEIRRKIVLSNEIIDEDGLRQQAVADGMLTLRGSAREVVKQGDTSVTELIRVTAGEH